MIILVFDEKSEGSRNIVCFYEINLNLNHIFSKVYDLIFDVAY